jgi:hypothetical protein
MRRLIKAANTMTRNLEDHATAARLALTVCAEHGEGRVLPANRVSGGNEDETHVTSRKK